MNYNFLGIGKLPLDQPSQVEFNKRKNAEQDLKLSQLRNDVNTLLTQSPAGFLPVVYYGLTRGAQTYRFPEDSVITLASINGEIGDAFELDSSSETDNYISAVGVKTDEYQLTIIIRGDYTEDTDDFTLLNLRTGATQNVTIANTIYQQDASYLGDYIAQENKNKQITVLNDLELATKNAVFASVDYSGDDVYNWVNIGKYTNGLNGLNFYTINATTGIQYMRTGEAFLWTGNTTAYLTYTLNKNDIYKIKNEE